MPPALSSHFVITLSPCVIKPLCSLRGRLSLVCSVPPLNPLRDNSLWREVPLPSVLFALFHLHLRQFVGILLRILIKPFIEDFVVCRRLRRLTREGRASRSLVNGGSEGTGLRLDVASQLLKLRFELILPGALLVESVE